MPSNRKCFVNGTVTEIGFRAEEGLPLVATPYMRCILKGIFAKAQSSYPAILSHCMVMANHLHMLMVIEDPGMVKEFICYLKRELAHCINRFLGRKKHTVWCDGYDSPKILDAQKAMDRIVYFYTNPQTANLVEKIEDYPNFSTWQAFMAGGYEQTHHRVPRSAVPELPNCSLSLEQQQILADGLEAQGEDENTLFIDPDAWMQCFAELEDCDPEQINAEIVKRIRQREKELSEQRTKPVVGAHALKLASMRKEHTPKKRGKRMICLSSSRAKRKRYIEWYRELCREAREVFERWKAGDWLAQLPPGLFAPGGMLRANLVPHMVPLT